jgi:hypothetical protein
MHGVIFMQAVPDWETDQTISEIGDLVNFAVRLRTLVLEEGYTELSFRNPTTG